MTNVDPRALNHPMAGGETIDGVEVGVYRASAVGYCEHALLAARKGVEGAAPPEQMQKVFDEGHDNEARILDMFYEAEGNGYLKSATRGAKFSVDTTVEIWVGNTVIIRGHLDDIALHGDVRVVAEAKAVGKSLWKEWVGAIAQVETQGVIGNAGDWMFTQLTGLWQKYRDQAEIYMAASGATECAIIVGRKPEKEDGEEERGLVTEIKWVWVTRDDKRLALIKAKIAIVEAKARGNVPLPLVCDQQQYPCPYFFLMHEKKEQKTAIKVDSERLAEALKEHYDAGQAEKAGKKRKEKAKDVLDELWRALATNGDAPMTAGELYESGGYTVTYVERPMPAGGRKAYTQKFYDVKPIKP